MAAKIPSSFPLSLLLLTSYCILCFYSPVYCPSHHHSDPPSFFHPFTLLVPTLLFIHFFTPFIPLSLSLHCPALLSQPIYLSVLSPSLSPYPSNGAACVTWLCHQLPTVYMKLNKISRYLSWWKYQTLAEYLKLFMPRMPKVNNNNICALWAKYDHRRKRCPY